MNIRQEMHLELEQAEAARAAGNEGQARVCARRAAGIAARAYLNGQDIRTSNRSAYELLKMLIEFPGLAPDLRRAAMYLTQPVTPSFSLPENQDLIAEARRLCDRLGG